MKKEELYNIPNLIDLNHYSTGESRINFPLNWELISIICSDEKTMNIVMHKATQKNLWKKYKAIFWTFEISYTTLILRMTTY